MKYQFKYQTTALDLWRLSMYSLYGSMLASVNIIFTIAMVLLAVKFWGSVGAGLKVLLIAGICLFTVIQPIVVYIRARKQVKNTPDEISIVFDDKGVHVEAGHQTSDLMWNSIKGISRKPGMVIIHSTGGHGFILADRVLQDKKNAFYEYVESMIEF